MPREAKNAKSPCGRPGKRQSLLGRPCVGWQRRLAGACGGRRLWPPCRIAVGVVPAPQREPLRSVDTMFAVSWRPLRAAAGVTLDSRGSKERRVAHCHFLIWKCGGPSAACFRRVAGPLCRSRRRASSGYRGCPPIRFTKKRLCVDQHAAYSKLASQSPSYETGRRGATAAQHGRDTATQERG